MEMTLERFVDNLVRSRLMSAEELAAFQNSLPDDERPRGAQGLARALVQRGKLTRYQAAAVYQGRTQGFVLGPYVVVDKIASGGMSQVFEAVEPTRGRTVALKVLSARSTESPDLVRRFQREARAAARLVHPNIVTAYDAGEAEGTHYLVMEYVDGQDLSRIVKEHGPLSVLKAVDCTLQAAKGLQFAHNHGIVHRDIKPGNLLMDRDGKVKVLDMGLARIHDPLTNRGSIDSSSGGRKLLGTTEYMAPEQAEDTRLADHRADVYSLGCTLHRLLTGRPPYQDESFLAVIRQHRDASIPSLRTDRRDVSAPLDAVFGKMLAKRPEDRQQSMAEVIADLEACLLGRPPSSLPTAVPTTAADEPRPATPPAPPTALPTAEPVIVQADPSTARRLHRPVRRKNIQLLLIGLVGAVLFLAAALAALLLFGGSTPGH